MPRGRNRTTDTRIVARGYSDQGAQTTQPLITGARRNFTRALEKLTPWQSPVKPQAGHPKLPSGQMCPDRALR